MTSIQYHNQSRQFGKEITNTQHDSHTPNPLINNNANTGKDQLELLKKIHKQRSQHHINKENQGFNDPEQDPSQELSASQIYDFKTNKNYGKNQNSSAFSMTMFERELRLIEEKDKSIPENVSMYADSIFTYLRKIEKNHRISGQGIKKQHEITEQMRAVLIDWLISVHKRYKMVPETLFVTIGLIDKYLERNQIPRQKLQLLGITALFIAGKYEEIYPPSLKEYVDCTDRSYTKHEVLDMEGKILLSLNFNLTFPSSLRFLDRYSRLMNSKKEVYMLARYLIEIALLHEIFLKYDQSMIACAALYVANKIFNKQVPYSWPALVEHSTQYKEREIRPCAKDLLEAFRNIHNSKFQNVKNKFLSPTYMQIAKVKVEPTNIQQKQQQ